jgi:hypothetical protein
VLNVTTTFANCPGQSRWSPFGNDAFILIWPVVESTALSIKVMRPVDDVVSRRRSLYVNGALRHIAFQFRQPSFWDAKGHVMGAND